jgi:hypothetical protein
MVIVIDRKRVAEGFPRTLDDHRPHEVSMLHPDEQQRRPSRQAFFAASEKRVNLKCWAQSAGQACC